MAPARGSSHGLIDNFYLSKEELLHSTPSRREGVDAATEKQLRVFGCERVQLGVLYLRLPQAVAATGQVLLHRYYCKQSMTDYDVKQVAIAATWLASKLEESPRKFRDVLSVFNRIDRRADGRRLEPLDINSQEFEKWKAKVFDIEKQMLRALGFVTHVEHPHKFVLSLVQILGLPNSLLEQEAWNLTNDSLRTTLCVRFKSEVVACGIIFLAARRKQVPLPESPEGSWWDLCSVRKEDLLEVACEIQGLYSMPRAEYIQLGRPARPARTLPTAAAASPISLPPSPGPSALPNGDAGSGQRPASGSADHTAEPDAGNSSVPAAEGRDGDGTDSRGGQTTSAGDKARSSDRAPRSRSRSAEALQPPQLTRPGQGRSRSRSPAGRHSVERRPREADSRRRDREHSRNGVQEADRSRGRESGGSVREQHRADGDSRDRERRGRPSEAAGPSGSEDAPSDARRSLGREDRDRRVERDRSDRERGEREREARGREDERRQDDARKRPSDLPRPDAGSSAKRIRTTPEALPPRPPSRSGRPHTPSPLPSPVAAAAADPRPSERDQEQPERARPPSAQGDGGGSDRDRAAAAGGRGPAVAAEAPPRRAREPISWRPKVQFPDGTGAGGKPAPSKLVPAPSNRLPPGGPGNNRDRPRA